MLFDNPEDDARARVAFELLTDLCKTDDDFNLLIAVIRVYHEVRCERRELCMYFLGYLSKNGLLKRKRLSFGRAIEIVKDFEASDDAP